ncbi:hypothetical protein [Tenggerimyces flavus]|uniref:LigA protein n=1 Tax=Tenggerimyces flavus TaxID=1708749 RepID=A0ABV7YC72_9ACTN|nr:hypothetical protein [Tenggerimyces flavus]MBM7791342.1 hypothetical protein [Tenggerimyces flavus]
MRKTLAQVGIGVVAAALVLAVFGVGSWIGNRDVAPAATGAELQVISQANGGLWHSLRRANGAWTAFGNVYGETGNPGTTSLVATTKLGTDLAVVSVVSGRVFVTARHANGFWDGIAKIGECGAVSSVAAAGVGGELHVFAVTDDGTRLSWATRKADLTWSPFVDAFAVAGTPPGEVTDVAATEVGGLLHVAVVADGALHSATRQADGTWSPFAPVPGLTGTADKVSLTDVNGTLTLVATANQGEAIATATKTGATWSAFTAIPTNGVTGAVTSISAASVANALHLVVATETAVLHSTRTGDTWATFGQVGTNQPPGPTLDLGASGV